MSQQNSYPESNASLVIEEDATYTIVFTFNPNTKEVSATATKTDGLYFRTKGTVPNVRSVEETNYLCIQIVY